MSINILLYMLMFIALVAVIIMAVIVNIKLSKIDKLGKTETPEEYKYVDRDETETEPEVDEEITEPIIISEPETFEETDIESEPPPDILLPPEPESKLETEIEIEEETETSAIETYGEIETNLEADVEPELPELTENIKEEKDATSEIVEGTRDEYVYEGDPSKEPSSPFYDRGREQEVEETVDLEMPVYIEIPDEEEEKFEEVEPEVIEPSEPWYVPEEPIEEDEKEEDESIVTCPHCNSQVPKTIYCIYCGNSLKPNPLVEEP